MHLLLANNSAAGGAAAGAFESIATTTLSSGVGWVQFSNIPQTYQHLQVRILGRSQESGFYTSPTSVIINGVQTNSYSFHRLSTDGNSVSAFGSASVSRMDVGVMPTAGFNSNFFGNAIIDIHDYASTTKNKTVRAFSGFQTDTTVNNQGLFSGLFQSTSAVTSVAFSNKNNSFDWAIGSTFALYGIKGV